jgi:tetratricopeptide (TPR) repeat protein
VPATKKENVVVALADLDKFERKVHSQNGEDGVIEAIFAAIGVTNRFFVEFGVHDATECNTASLLEQGWTGLMMDGSGISNNPLATIHKEFITRENINTLFAKYQVPLDFDLLSIDIDGNDYWVWQALTYRPRVVVIEYNASVPHEYRLTVPYDARFRWDLSEFFGASLRALAELGASKGYELVYCERAGVNAFFVVRSALTPNYVAKPLAEIYRPPNYFYQGLAHKSEPLRGMIDPRFPDGGRITILEARKALVAELFPEALQHHLRGDLASAEPLYRRVLEMDDAHADANSNLGVVLHMTGRPKDALLCFRRAVEINPHQADALNNLGNALKDQGQTAEAADCFRRALAINPNHANAHCNLGNTQIEEGRLPDAIESFRQAIRCNPNYENAHFNLGNALRDLGKLAEAIECYRQTLRVSPNLAKAHNNLGNVFKDLGRLEEAANCFQQALRLDPKHVGAHINFAVVLQDQGKFEEAFTEYEKALILDPGSVVARSNRSMVRLLLGDFARGWPEYEHRSFQTENDKRYFRQPLWDGSSLADKTILVYAEQGLGDTLQFIRYAALVKERRTRLLFECQPALASLIERVSGVDQVIHVGDALPEFDVQVPLLSIPGILRTTLETIPAKVPYVSAKKEFVERWGQEMIGQASTADDFKIGIVWQGNPKYRADRARSIPLAHFEELARVSGVRFISLQIGAGTKQMPAANFPITDLGSHFDLNSLEDLAGAMMNLDLLITSDTAVPHLAGALGLPVWLALSYIPDWRWLLDRTDCPWYPTMRLFRQRRPGDWDDVFERMATELEGLRESSKRG